MDRTGSAVRRPDGHGLTGHLRLRARRLPDGSTAVGEQSFRAPFHIGKGYWDGTALQVRIVNPTAGILEGDQLELDAAVDSGASLVLTTPSATRAFTMQAGSAGCRQHFSVAADGWLECAPEPLFPHAGCDYRQSTRLDIDPAGAAYFVDCLAPGRAGRGELWAWRRLQLTLEVAIGGKVRLRERLDASGPELGLRARFHRMPEAWFATVVIYSPRLPDDFLAATAGVSDPGRALATRLAEGLFLARVVAPGGLALRDSLAALRTAATPHLPALASDLRRL